MSIPLHAFPFQLEERIKLSFELLNIPITYSAKQKSSFMKISLINLLIYSSMFISSTMIYAQSSPFPKWRIGATAGFTPSWFYDSDVGRQFNQDASDGFQLFAAWETSYLVSKRFSFDGRLFLEQKSNTSARHLRYRHVYITGELTMSTGLFHKKLKPLLIFLYTDKSPMELWTYLAVGVYEGHMVFGREGAVPIEHPNLNKRDFGIALRLYNQAYKRDYSGRHLAFNFDYGVHFGLTRVLDYKIITAYTTFLSILPTIRVSYIL